MNGPDDHKKGTRQPPQMRTRLIHGEPHSARWDYAHHVVPPMTASATFRLDSAARGAQAFAEFAHWEGRTDPPAPIYVYDRLDEPTCGMLEDNLAAAEGGDFGLCFASGMAAISAAICTLTRAGERVVAHKVLYGCTYSLLSNWLPRFGIDHRLVDMTDPSAVRSAITEQTRVLYFETPVNPSMEIIDIAGIRRIADEVNRDREGRDRVRVVVDNTFASPHCQRPIECGADVVCESLTKAIGGFGTDIGGVVVGPRWLHDPLIMFRKDFGAALSPKSAWPPLVYGLPTLATRMVNYQKTAHRVAHFLENHPKIERVLYPGLESYPWREAARKQMRDDRGVFAPGSMITFFVRDPDGSGAPAARLIDAVAKDAYSITLAVSLGQIKTLIEAPYSMTHAAMPEAEKRERGLLPGMVRLSVGLEDWHDLIEDLRAGLDSA